MKIKLLLLLMALSNLCFAQYRVLVYHETNGFRHGSINAGIQMFEDLGAIDNRWTVDNSQNSNVFNATNLAQYDVVVWCNTSGNNLLNASERTAFENYITSGGGFVGIHAATDTYRDGSWPFYNELVGAIVQTSPNHTSNNFNATMDVEDTTHPTVSHLGTTWNKNEEYYYWELNGGQLSTDNNVLLRVRSTGSNSYDAPRPITWYKTSMVVNGTSISGFRAFYTALGHNSGDYNGNSDFRTMMENAVLWAANDTTLSVEGFLPDEKVSVYPNPVKDMLSISFENEFVFEQIQFYDTAGKKVNARIVHELDDSIHFDIGTWSAGVYFYQVRNKDQVISGKLIKE
ncbi:ThuA domain-containing protein [Sungkyunkwania multivorans]|uniref:ThuA domain-containing protein n=1 Tax=Sungkyunkwania multivorans TaxID=1173618 RepID=A0ABW3CX28_9FLAO